MKITLPLFLLFALSIQAQTTIYKLNGTTASEATDGVNHRIYAMYDPATVFNQSASGFNQTWDISGFTEIADQTKSYGNTVPTAEEQSQFPGTTMVTAGFVETSEGSVPASKAFASGDAVLLGYTDETFILLYNIDSADYGQFPQTYGDLHLDNVVAGEYTYGEYSGTFVGTLITEVDAYGNMITATEGTIPVTRLKSVETLQINYPGFGNVGTYVQTTYRYYRENDLWPFVKSTNTVLDIELLNIHNNTTNIEKAPAAFLSVQNPDRNGTLAIVPNPVAATAEIVSRQNVLSVVITDNSGKEVYSKKGTSHLDLSALPAGIYLAKIQTSEGTSIKKIIKN